MELINKDGKFFIDKKDYDAIHAMHKKLPEYKKSAEQAIRAADFALKDLRWRRNELAKFRNVLGEVEYFFNELSMGGEDEHKKQAG